MKNLMIKSLFEDNYIYAPVIYKLLTQDKLNYYVEKLKADNNLENCKNFLMMIDNFIDYLVVSLNLNFIHLPSILDNIFDKLDNSIFITNNHLKQNYRINRCTCEYKKIILSKFRNNLIFIQSKLGYMMDIYKLDINDDKELFNFLIECCNIRKNHQYILFDDFNQYLNNNKNTEFYIFLWKLMFQKLEEYYINNNLIA